MLRLDKKDLQHIHAIMNVHEDVTSEDQAIKLALDYVAQMCDDNALESGALFHVGEDDNGKNTLFMVL